MGIKLINRITGSTNNIVYIETTDNLATASAANYILNQLANITAINEGPWTWEPNDLIDLSASDGVGLFTINSTFSSLIAFAGTQLNPLATLIHNFTLTEAQWNAMYTTPVLVLPAAGAGLAIIPQLITLELVYGGVAITGGGNVGFEYGSTAHLAGLVATNTEQATDFTGASANTIYKFVANTGNGSQAVVSGSANVGLYISNDTAVFAGGTGTTYNGTILYHLLPVV